MEEQGPCDVGFELTFEAPRPEAQRGEEVPVVPARRLELGLRPVVRELKAGPAPAVSNT